MIEKITKDNQGSAAHSPLLYFFCDKKGNEESRLKCISVIRSFFFQLWITTSNSEDPNLTEFWRKLVSSVDLERPYYLPSYTRAARELMNLIPEIFIVLDGLDECEDRASLLSEVIALFKESRTRMRLFITSRPEPDLLKALQNYPTVEILPHSTKADMHLVIEETVQRAIDGGELKLRDTLLKTEIIETLKKGANGM